jgi:hypothetical protein
VKGADDTLFEEEKFSEFELPKIIKTDPSKIKVTMIETVNRTMGPYGTVRIKKLKLLFKSIIENIIPDSAKIHLRVYKELSVREMIDCLKVKEKK